MSLGSGRVLIFGGRGFVGRAFVPFLADLDMDLHFAGRHGVAEKHFGTFHELDMLDVDGVGRLMRELRPEYLVNFAWVTEHGRYWTSSENKTWAAASLELFKQFLGEGGKRALCAGTSAEYDLETGGKLAEEAGGGGRSPYGIAKFETYRAAKQLFDAHGASLVWPRLFCPFGPHEDRRRLVPRTCLALLAGEKIQFDAGSNAADFMHVVDVADALGAVWRSSYSGAINIASGEATEIREVVGWIAAELERSSLVVFGDGAEMGKKAGIAFADTMVLRDVIGWRPQRRLRERIADICAWWKSQINL